MDTSVAFIDRGAFEVATFVLVETKAVCQLCPLQEIV